MGVIYNMPVANSVKAKLLLIGIMVCITAIAVVGLYLYNEWRIGNETENEYAELRNVVQATDDDLQAAVNQGAMDQNDAPSEIELENIPEVNIPAGKDIVGWIKSEGTIIDYPVMQGKDNDYYLNHLYNGKYSKVGSIFMDFRNDPGLSDKNTLLYGHHMKSGKMFAELEKYKKQEYFDEHQVVYYFDADSNPYRIEVFAAVVVSGMDGIPVGFANDGEYMDYVAGLRERSAINSNVEVNENDRIISMIACTYDFANARIMVIGKLVKV